MQRIALSTLGVAVLSVCALAQEPPANGSPAKFSTANVTGIVAEPTGLVGIGRDYKAWFTPGRVEFTPALGEAAPHNLPLQWTLHDVRRGERVLHTADGGVAPQRDGNAVVFARASLVERYDVRVEGIEQSFVFAERLAGAGDLVVRCRIVTELAPIVNGPNDVEWTRAGIGGVYVRKVVGIDADGRRVDGSMRLTDGMLELVLPGAFVDTAHFPLVLDPSIGSTYVISGTDDAVECDVAHGTSSEPAFAVWSRRLSGSDYDVLGVAIDSNGAVASNVVAFDVTTAYSRRPRVCFVSGRVRHFVVWERAASLLASRDILCAAVDHGPGVASRSGVVEVSILTPDAYRPAVGGSSTSAMVLYGGPAGVHAHRVDVGATGNPSPLPSFLLLATGGGFDDMAISTTDVSGHWTAAWRFPGLLSDDIAVRTVTSSLAMGAVTVLGSTVLDEGRPAVDGELIVWERRESTFPNATRDIVAARVDAVGALVVGPIAVASRSGVDEVDPDVVDVGLRSCVSHTRRDGTLSDDVVVGFVNDDLTPCGDDTVFSGINTGTFVREGSATLAFAAGPLSFPIVQIVMIDSSNVAPFAGTAVAALMGTYSGTCPGKHVPYGAGCYGDSMYEYFPDALAATAALDGNRLALVPNAVGYVATWVSGGASTWAIPVGATVIPRTDDGEHLLDLTAIVGPAASLPTPPGPATTLYVHSNGFVSLGAGNDGGAWNNPAVDHVPTASFRNAPQTAFFAWHDWNPADTAGGAILWHYIPGSNRLCITWDGVENYSTPTASNQGSFQFQFDLTTGQVDYLWLALDGNTTSSRGSAHLVGYSPGGASADPGSVSFASAGTARTIAAGAPMRLSASPDPEILSIFSNPITYTVDNMPDFAPPGGARIGLLFFSFGSMPGVDLGFLGADGCQLNIPSLDVSFPISTVGSSSQSVVLTFPLPLSVGLSFYSQAVAFFPPNSLPGGLNTFGMLTSNGLRTTF